VRRDGGGVLEVHQGETANLDLLADASGTISCGVGPGNPAGLTVATDYGIAGDGVVSSGDTTGPLPFFSDGHLILFPPARCGVAWTGAPAPYRIAAKVATASTTPVGDHQVPIATTVANPPAGVLGPLQDNASSSFTVRVLPERNPPVLPNPHENQTLNVFPLVGDVRIRFRGRTRFVPLLNPIQISVGSELDLTDGHVELVSDGNGRGGEQSAEFWAGFAKVGYTRKDVPNTTGGRRASDPITELVLSRPLDLGCAGSSNASTSSVESARRRRHRRRRRMWGRGRGRYRTRSRYGAATVRGTRWLSEEGCTGARFTIVNGKVSVRNFVTHVSVLMSPGQSYFIAKPDRRKGRSVG
jgi:hypothetical protein